MSDELQFAHYPFEGEDPPESWEITALNNVLENIRPGFASGQHNKDGEGIPHLRPMNISPSGSIDLSEVLYVQGDNSLRLRRGDVLFNNTNSPAWVGKTTLIETDDELAFSNHMTRLRISSAVDPKFIAKQLHFLCSQGYFRHHCKKHVNQASIATEFLSRCVPVRIPPAPEQRRIVAKIEALQERSRRAREALSEVGSLLEQFRQSVLAAAFRIHADVGKIKTRRGVPKDVLFPDHFRKPLYPSSWYLASVGDLLHLGMLIDIKDGNHGSNHPQTSQFTPEGLPFITASQVLDYRIDYETAPKVSGEPLAKLRVGFAEVGDVVLTHKGTVGRTAINTEPCVLTPQTTYYRCQTECIDPTYLMYYLSSPVFQEQLASVMSQTTRNFVPISEQYLLFILVPHINEQHTIAAVLNASFDHLRELANASKGAHAQLDQLDQAILAKAFRGELVPQDPSDEPASVLLERIRAQREQQAEATEKTFKMRRRNKMEKKSSGLASQRRPLAEVLAAKGQPMPPEQLLTEAGYDDGSIEDFYLELREEMKKGRIREDRPSEGNVMLEAAKQ